MSTETLKDIAAATAVAATLTACATTVEQEDERRTAPDSSGGDPTVALAALKDYSFGGSRESLTVVADMVRDAAKTDEGGKALAEQLTDIALDPSTSPAILNFVCRQLALVGTPEEARRLAPLLLDPATTDDARYAIHPIPGRRVDQVLLDALQQASDGKVRAGIINTLAARRVQSARAAIETYTGSSDPVLAEVSRSALAALAG